MRTFLQATLCGAGLTLGLLLGLLLVMGCGATLKQRFPADPGGPIMTTNIVGGVTNIAPFDIGGLHE